jgi:hypothetical protein
LGFQSPIFSDVSIVGEIRLASLFSTVAGASPHLFEVELSTAVFVAWECLPFSKRPAFRALLRCFWRDRVSVFCAAFAELAMFSNVSKHLLNICLFMDRLRGQEGEGILASRLPWVPGQLRKVPKPTTQKGAKMPKNQILVVAQLARLPCAPTEPLGSPNARKQCLDLVSTCQGDYFPPISLLLVFSPCGFTTTFA